jgi:hypothetical protein
MGEYKYSSIILDRGTKWKWSATRLGRFAAGEKAPSTHWIGGWVGPRAGLNALVNYRNMFIQPVACRYTD